MGLARILRPVLECGIAAALLAACAKPGLLDENLSSGGAPATEFSIDDQSVTLTARFSAALAADAPLKVEWLFPDGKVYLRKPVRRSFENPELVETAMPVRGKAPARYPGVWRVQLWRGDDKLVDRSFEIRQPGETAAASAALFSSLAHCGPSRWNDPVISGRRGTPDTTRAPGAWIGNALLDAAGATYSGAVLLTGCAPG